MATPTKNRLVKEVTDELQYLNIDTPCGKRKQTNSRLQGRVKGKILFYPDSKVASTKWNNESYKH